MNRLRCQCGKSLAWTSYGEIVCQACPFCNTTLVADPDHYREPEPHIPKMSYSSETGKPQRLYCERCHATLPMPTEELP